MNGKVEGEAFWFQVIEVDELAVAFRDLLVKSSVEKRGVSGENMFVGIERVPAFDLDGNNRRGGADKIVSQACASSLLEILLTCHIGP